MASNIENVITKCMRKELNYIVENIDPELYYNDLFSANILSWEECENIEQDRKNFGKTRQTRTLINKMLQKPESQVCVFLDMMREKESHVWERIEATRRGVESGDVQLHHKIDVKSRAESLMAMYKEKAEWRHLEPIPGEKITLDVGDDQDLFMQPVFTTQIIDSGKQDMFRFSGTNDPKYTDIKCENLEGIFELSKNASKDEKIIEMSRKNKVHSNLHTVAGVAGVGKTTAMHRMVWDWASKMGKIHDHYDLVFFIPVRKTEKEQEILDVLVKNLGFLPHNEKEAFHEHMNDPQCAGKVLFIFDGADESELSKDIGEIIVGKLYPNSTVVVTMRPEAKSVKTLGVLKPVISVSMQGTNEKSVHTFIHKMLQNKEKSKVEALFQKCKQSIYDFKLLCIPLYLMLICLVFREESFNMTNLSVPSTMTELFNMIFHVIINRWVERTIGTIGQVTFKKSPLEAEDSNIPVEIKRTLLSISNMCYNALCDKKYEFHQNDLNQFCLSSEDIVKSGLFHVSGSGDNLLIYLKHKQLQEYLAAMFLTYQGHKTPPCSHLFTKAENKSLPQAVGAENLNKTIQFCCGMSQKFCQYIFTTAIKCCVIEKTWSGGVDVYYEASLVQESHSEEIMTLFQKYLLESEIKIGLKNASDSTLSSLKNCLSDVTRTIPQGDAIQLLKTLYDLEVTGQSSNVYKIKHAKTKMWSKESKGLKLSICLDQLSLELLSKFTFPQVETVQVRTWDTAYIDMCVISDIFPTVRSVDIGGRNTVPYKCVRGADTQTQVTHSKLTHMSIYSLNHLHLPDDLELILHQPNLSYLNMCNVYALDSIGRGAVRCSLSALGELVLNLFTRHTEPSSVTGLCKLLESCPQLHTLRLNVVFSDDVAVTPVLTQISHMTHLTHMYIVVWPVRHTQAVLHSVSDLPRLSHLSIHVSCIRGVEEEVTQALCRSRSLRSLTLWDWDSEGKPTGYTFPPHCVHTLRKHRVTVSVKTPDRPNTLDEAIMLFKKL